MCPSWWGEKDELGSLGGSLAPDVTEEGQYFLLYCAAKVRLDTKLNVLESTTPQ